MNLGRMLYLLRHSILHDDSDLVPGAAVSDQLWTDEDLVLYIDEAQRQFAIDSLILRDGNTPEVTDVNVIAGQQEYTLHSSVIAVISARNRGDHADLARAGHSDFSTYHVPDAYFFDPGSLSGVPPGKVLAYDTDEFFVENDFGSLQVVNLKVYPKPAAPYITPIKLRVVRKPLRPLTLENLDAVPEIPDNHHFQILDYAAHLALRKVDRDAEDQARSAAFLQSFTEKVEKAKQLAQRKSFRPLQWNFGRNGFSWDNVGQ